MRIINSSFFRMLLAFILCVILCCLFFFWYGIVEAEWVFTVGLIMGYTAIHFIIMFATAPIVFMLFRNKYNYRHMWFRPKGFEKKLYRILMLKKWKNKIPTYDQSAYSIQKHNAEKVIQMMCHAEIVHDLIALLSYLPVFVGIYTSHYGLLIALSFSFSIAHLSFVAVQRFNRPRIVRLYEATQKKLHSNSE